VKEDVAWRRHGIVALWRRTATGCAATPLPLGAPQASKKAAKASLALRRRACLSSGQAYALWRASRQEGGKALYHRRRRKAQSLRHLGMPAEENDSMTIARLLAEAPLSKPKSASCSVRAGYRKAETQQNVGKLWHALTWRRLAAGGGGSRCARWRCAPSGVRGAPGGGGRWA
jgi:hypothetical protein